MIESEGIQMNPMFDKHQWRLILRALRERRGHEMCGTKWYQEYSDMIIAIENGMSNITEATEDDWEDFWSSDSRELTSNGMY
jgi:hypothetical protein|tara:strand:- start:370 stop:615 length:246 start_codon:yes stop_codon:yes gene_type:complete